MVNSSHQGPFLQQFSPQRLKPGISSPWVKNHCRGTAFLPELNDWYFPSLPRLLCLLSVLVYAGKVQINIDWENTSGRQVAFDRVGFYYDSDTLFCQIKPFDLDGCRFEYPRSPYEIKEFHLHQNGGNTFKFKLDETQRELLRETKHLKLYYSAPTVDADGKIPGGSCSQQ
jgi:hypothetical protein